MAMNKKNKKIRVEPEGVGYIKSTFNNTVITLTDKYGNTISWASAGVVGFKGSRKNTPFAAAQAAEKAAQDAMSKGLMKLKLELKDRVVVENLQ